MEDTTRMPMIPMNTTKIPMEDTTRMPMIPMNMTKIPMEDTTRMPRKIRRTLQTICITTMENKVT